jgi:hypothetical protein
VGGGGPGGERLPRLTTAGPPTPAGVAHHLFKPIERRGRLNGLEADLLLIVRQPVELGARSYRPAQAWPASILDRSSRRRIGEPSRHASANLLFIRLPRSGHKPEVLWRIPMPLAIRRSYHSQETDDEKAPPKQTKMSIRWRRSAYPSRLCSGNHTFAAQ